MSSLIYIENIRGSDLAGAEGTGRTYQPTNASIINTATITSVVIDNSAKNSPEYSYDSSTNTLTFNMYLDDTAYIKLVYYAGVLSVATNTYCDETDVQAILQKSTAFSASTNPTTTQIQTWIAAAEDWIDNCTGHAWRERYSATETGEDTSANYEYYDIPEYYIGRSYKRGAGIKIYLKKRKIRQFDSSQGDALELWNGSEYIDYLSDKIDGRNEDYWLDLNKGILYLRRWIIYYTQQALRLKYRYGDTTVPQDIRDAASLYAAARALSSDDQGMQLPETGDPTRMTYDVRASKWMAQAKAILRSRAELTTI
jgi:hypothetical protein